MIGIYKITNKVNGKAYIGSSNNIGKRWELHINRLECNKHDNKYLQQDFNNFGFYNFTFEILKECKKDELLQIEKEYIDINSNNSYNIVGNINTPYIKPPIFNKNINVNLNFNILSQRIILVALDKYYTTGNNIIIISCSDITKNYNIDHSVYIKGFNRIYEDIKFCELFKSISQEECSTFKIEFDDKYYFLSELFHKNEIIKKSNNFVRKGTLHLLIKMLCNNKSKTLYYDLEVFKKEYNIENLKSYSNFCGINNILLKPMINELEPYFKTIKTEKVMEYKKLVGFKILFD